MILLVLEYIFALYKHKHYIISLFGINISKLFFSRLAGSREQSRVGSGANRTCERRRKKSLWSNRTIWGLSGVWRKSISLVFPGMLTKQLKGELGPTWVFLERWHQVCEACKTSLRAGEGAQHLSLSFGSISFFVSALVMNSSWIELDFLSH